MRKSENEPVKKACDLGVESKRRKERRCITWKDTRNDLRKEDSLGHIKWESETSWNGAKD